MNLIRYFSLLILYSIYIGCGMVGEDDIVGDYKVDKVVQVGEPGTTMSYTLLSIKQNNEFELQSNAPVLIKGSWEVTNARYERNFAREMEQRATILFSYSGQTIKGELKGNIINFHTPDVFQKDRDMYTSYVRIYK